jgi:competence ComEA-like helix-hairpin-helix protein
MPNLRLPYIRSLHLRSGTRYSAGMFLRRRFQLSFVEWSAKFRNARWIGLWTMLGFVLCVGGPNLAAQVSRQEGSESKWEILHDCRLVTNQVVDGDSFHVRSKEREYIFRLYFVDSPESDATLKDRIKEQAAFFGISTNDIPRAGELAARFTRDTLTGKDFTVIHRWQNAMGRSSLARYYAVVLVNGTNLAELLIVNGYARIKGPRANWPDGPQATVFVSKLKNLELTAREKKLGVWNQSAFPLETDAPTTALTNKLVSASVDVNAASFEELQKLPGIGPKLAERIIAHRPYQSVKELDKVPGIGSAKLKQLEPMIRVGSAAP